MAVSIDETMREQAQSSSAWPFQEARKLSQRLREAGFAGDRPVLFETGYGPSGLPHIGTFAEVARTSMVRHAFEALSGQPTRLLCFSDDMDGLRKIPENLPDQPMLARHLGKPLSHIPDPYGSHESFAHHNNARLCAFLDSFGFDYEFVSSSDCYQSGRFDEALLQVLAHYDAVMTIILPSLGPERAASYSPFLPLHPRTGVVTQTPIERRDVEAGTVIWRDEQTKEYIETPVTGGHCKLQWKPDWAMRWLALGVDYEMAGKDLIDSVTLGGRICRTLGGRPPAGFNYELFLDAQGQKISKSRGNGLTIEEWRRYGSPESLQQFLYHKPREAKRLHFGVIPKSVDDYLSHAAAFDGQSVKQRLSNPVWHIHQGPPPHQAGTPVSFALLLNLASASHASDKTILWGFIRRYADGVSPESHPMLDALAGYAIAYFRDIVEPTLAFRRPDESERCALVALEQALADLPPGADAQDIQNLLYALGKAHEYTNLRNWFAMLYEVLLGQKQGPRLGSFIALYGIEPTRALIVQALEGKLAGD